VARAHVSGSCHFHAERNEQVRRQKEIKELLSDHGNNDYNEKPKGIRTVV
jgi:hypothetical protein